MEPIFITIIVIVSFSLGFFVHQKICTAINQDNIIIKRHRDIVNWLKSELAQAKNNKLGKRIDNNKVKLLKLIVKKLQK